MPDIIVIRRRYARGIANLLPLYTPIADTWALSDNSAVARIVAKREAGLDAWRRHKALGHPIVIWRDGKVVVVPPEEIEV